jgi:voltage-gated potassium channel
MIILPYKQFIKVYVAILLFVLIFLIGTIGYITIEGFNILEAVYMTVITLASVGFSEVHPLSETGRWFTIVLILTNIGIFTYFITQVSSHFLNGEFITILNFMRMKNSINNLEGHIIICGLGRNGKEAAKIFATSNRDFVVIEQNIIQKESLDFDLKFVLQGDAINDDILVEAGIKKAYALITTLPKDADNLYVVLTAKELNNKIKIVSRASNDTSVKKLKTAGADNVIMPDKIGGAHMATLILSPDVKEFIDVMSTVYSNTFKVTEILSLVDISTKELDSWNTTGATILGIKKPVEGFILNPGIESKINSGNRIIAMGSKEQLNKLSHKLNGKEVIL